MKEKITNSFSLENIKFRRCCVGNGKISGRTFKDKVVAIRKLLLDACDTEIFQDEEHWKHLINLRDDNLVQYHQCRIEGEAR